MRKSTSRDPAGARKIFTEIHKLNDIYKEYEPFCSILLRIRVNHLSSNRENHVGSGQACRWP